MAGCFYTYGVVSGEGDIGYWAALEANIVDIEVVALILYALHSYGQKAVVARVFAQVAVHGVPPVGGGLQGVDRHEGGPFARRTYEAYLCRTGRILKTVAHLE